MAKSEVFTAVTLWFAVSCGVTLCPLVDNYQSYG